MGLPRRGLEPRPDLVKGAYRGGVVSVWDNTRSRELDSSRALRRIARRQTGWTTGLRLSSAVKYEVLDCCSIASGHRVKSLEEGGTQYGARV